MCLGVGDVSFLTRIERISTGLKLASFIILVHDYIKGTWNLIVQNKGQAAFYLRPWIIPHYEWKCIPAYRFVGLCSFSIMQNISRMQVKDT